VESGLLQAWKTKGGHRRVLRESVETLLRKGPAPERTPPGSMAAVPAPRRLRIMVVEDDVVLLRLYRTQMGFWPMAPEVMVMDNAVAALLAIGRNPPDFLVTDLLMPGMDGFNMLRVLHQTPEVAHTTIAVVSGLDAAEIAQRGGLPNGIEILPKPVPFERLRAIATAIVQRGQLAGALPGPAQGVPMKT
jgi:DNA-binding response OmpR family regulator